MATATINGTDIHYELIGEGKPLLMIHGLASSLQDWLFQVPRLYQENQLILVDLRGHGKTGRASDYSIDLMADDLYQLLERLNINSCHVMGISMGGMVAMVLGELITVFVV